MIGGTPEDLPLWIADMDFAVCPEVTKALRAACAQQAFGYTFQGDVFKEAVSGWFKRRHDVMLEPSWIVPCQSVLGAMQILMDALLEEGDGVMLFTPVYPPFYEITAHRKLQRNDLTIISAIDTAIWDLKGKLLGVSVATLLGGKHRTKLRSYASQIQMGWKDNQSVAPNESPEEFKEACQRVVSMGYTAVKANVIGLNEQKQRRTYQETMSYIEKSVLKRAEQRLAAMRDGVGPDVGIIMENHCITDGNTAIQFARIAEEYDVMLMEEPAVPTNIEVFNKIASYTSIPLATGEHTYLRSGFRPLIESGSVSVLQPDLGNCGGFTEAKKIADHAAQYDIGIQAHVCSGPISHAASLQFEAAIPNFYYHEGHLTNTLPQIIEMGTEDYPTVNGYIEVPDKPGIGMDLSEKALKEANIITIQ